MHWPLSSGRTRALAIVIVAAAVGVLVSQYVGWLLDEPPSVTAKADTRGHTADLTLQTVGSLGPGHDHPGWVSYLADDPKRGWIQSTDLRVPAHSLVRVTIYQYDTSTGLRNPNFARVQGTSGATMQVDGRTVKVIDPTTTSHTFAIPQLDVYVPLPGVADDASNQCSQAPCSSAEAHRTIAFTFRTAGPGHYRWQCFVPCAAGFVTGFGGPMQTLGYMDGFLTVA